jgi:nicotinamidase-related amidase
VRKSAAPRTLAQEAESAKVPRMGSCGAMSMVKRIVVDRCCGVLVDYQDFFLSQLEARARYRLQANTTNFLRLLGYLRIPMIATMERPIKIKGTVPDEIKHHLGRDGKVFEKDFFDLTREKPIRAHLKRLKKTQAIVAGCETDVCVLQSCLGLLELGFEVFAVEELLFSSARDVDAALMRMRSEGVTMLSYKTLFFELTETVSGGPHAEKTIATFGEFPDDLPEEAVP